MHADATHEWVVQKLELRDKEVEQKVIRDNKIRRFSLPNSYVSFGISVFV